MTTEGGMEEEEGVDITAEGGGGAEGTKEDMEEKAVGENMSDPAGEHQRTHFNRTSNETRY
jgi:hypothetical protein